MITHVKMNGLGRGVMDCLKCSHAVSCASEENDGFPFCTKLDSILYGDTPKEYCPLPENEKQSKSKDV